MLGLAAIHSPVTSLIKSDLRKLGIVHDKFFSESELVRNKKVDKAIDQLKDSTKWKKMIVDKELEGIQIMADNAWRSAFVKEYLIEGIPRFILIDQSGNIISPNAPRPASYNEGNYELSDEIQILLDENL